MPPLDGTQLPAALIDRFGGDAQDRLVALLRFLRPGHRRRPHARFLTGAADPQSMLVAGVRTLCLRSGAP